MNVMEAVITVNPSEGLFRQGQRHEVLNFAAAYRRFGRPLYATAVAVR